MNKLGTDKQATIIRALLEGNSIRSVERMTGAHRDTVMRLGVRVGEGCARLLDERMRNLDCKDLQCDELWTYIKKKQRQMTDSDDPAKAGDFWTWMAIDSETKLIPSFHLGGRTQEDARIFLGDLASRVSGRIQLSADGFPAYVEAVYATFGSGVDFGQSVKYYETEKEDGKYSPPRVTHVERTPRIGAPDKKKISTSYAERQNLSMRTGMKRMQRLTLGFSKSVRNHRAATALWFAHYNFSRVHRTLRTTPAQAAGLEASIWSVEDLIAATSA